MTENATVEATPLSSLDKADAMSQATAPIATVLINNYNEIATRNSAKTKGVDEIAADLVESSQDAKVVSLRTKIAELQEQVSKAVLEEAKAIKEKAGEPDLDAEKNALEAMRNVLKAMATFENGKEVIANFLPKPVTSNVGRVTGAATASSGPKNDLSAVREWAKKNGYEVGDRGRIAEDIHEAYAKAHAK